MHIDDQVADLIYRYRFNSIGVSILNLKLTIGLTIVSSLQWACTDGVASLY